MRPAILCCRAFLINAPTNIAIYSSLALIELLFRLFFSVVALWQQAPKQAKKRQKMALNLGSQLRKLEELEIVPIFWGFSNKRGFFTHLLVN